jgi:two-component system, OmpR family, response regulator ResD
MKSILIIDDDPVLRRSMTAILAKNYHVFTFRCWEQAAVTVTAIDFDMVLIDVVLPGLQGNETVAKIRSKQRGRLVLLSSLPAELLTIYVLNCKADGYIKKSNKPKEIRQQVHSLLTPAEQVNWFDAVRVEGEGPWLEMEESAWGSC